MTSLFEEYKVYGKDEIEQGSKEWLELRNLKFTASNADTISANGKGLETLVKEMLAEYYSSQEFEEYTGKFKSADMQRGNDYEAMARSVYELETGNTVKEVGFIQRSKYIGCSPDGLVDESWTGSKEEGLIEIKNHSDKVFLELMLTGKVDPKYVKQMQYQMWVTQLNWCDYFGFNPNFSPNFYKERFYPDEALHKKFEAGVSAGIEMIENGLDALKDKLKVLNKVVEVIEEKEEPKLADMPINKVKLEKSNNGTGDDFPF